MIDFVASHSQIWDELLDEVDAIMHQAALGGRDPLLNKVEEGTSIQAFTEGAGMFLVTKPET